MSNPLDELAFPVYCASCGEGPFGDGVEVDEHITEEHLLEAVWTFACDHMKPEPKQGPKQETGDTEDTMSRSRMTHAICDPCWKKVRPDVDPFRVVEPDPENCCYCGKETTSGIFIRANPNLLRCKGLHPIIERRIG